MTAVNDLPNEAAVEFVEVEIRARTRHRFAFEETGVKLARALTQFVRHIHLEVIADGNHRSIPPVIFGKPTP